MSASCMDVGLWMQTCLVYAVGVENYTFEAQATQTTQMILLRLHDSDKCDSVLFFDAILFLTRPLCSKGVGPFMIRAHQVLQ